MVVFVGEILLFFLRYFKVLIVKRCFMVFVFFVIFFVIFFVFLFLFVNFFVKIVKILVLIDVVFLLIIKILLLLSIFFVRYVELKVFDSFDERWIDIILLLFLSFCLKIFVNFLGFG